MTNSSGLETFVNSIQNLYQRTEASSINYTEVFNLISSHSEVFSANIPTLLDNVLPIFTLPEYTLPNMACLYAIVVKLNNQATQNSNLSPNAVAPSGSDLNINQEQLLTCLENCIGSADKKQVDQIWVIQDIVSFLKKCPYKGFSCIWCLLGVVSFFN